MEKEPSHSQIDELLEELPEAEFGPIAPDHVIRITDAVMGIKPVEIFARIDESNIASYPLQPWMADPQRRRALVARAAERYVMAKDRDVWYQLLHHQMWARLRAEKVATESPEHAQRAVQYLGDVRQLFDEFKDRVRRLERRRWWRDLFS